MQKLLLLLAAQMLLAFGLQAQKVTFVIETSHGTMKGYLYDDVPRHAEAFARHAEKGAFDGTLFTRVIPSFMIQGGAADSRHAKPGARVGSGDTRKEIEHESSKGHFYKKGALAAPKQEVKTNPKRRSDMSQFFIVQGELYTHGYLDTLQMVVNNPIKQKAFKQIYEPKKALMDSLRTADPRAYNALAQEINAAVDSILMASPKRKFFTPEERQAYTEHGGLPRYTEDYTIYGEVTEGLEVIDKIARLKRDQYDRPHSDVRIKKVTIIRR